ncbi:MAG: hypothetical protein H7Y60_14235 [Rhodospirillaceae bacterium]|nr:hypothetical protein [Rhodospirillales bacterium]
MSTPFLRIIVLMALMASMVLAMVPVSGGHWEAHSPVAAALAQARLAVEIEEHGHVHDDGDVDVQAPGHSHGHNPADHSHETPSLPASLAVIFNAYGQSWQIRYPALPVLETVFRLERPPRPMLDA